MNILDRFLMAAKAFTARSTLSGDSNAAVRQAEGEYNQLNWPNLGLYTDQGYEFACSSFVYQAIGRISAACALVPLNVVRLDGETKTPLVNHPIEQLLRNPNPYQSQFEFLESLYAFADLNGNSYVLMSSEGGGVPTDLDVLRPDRIRILVDKKRYIIGYMYVIGGREIPLDLGEVMHIKTWNPIDDLYGLSPMQAAAIASQSDVLMARFNRNTFKEGAVIPAGVITIKNMISDTEFDRIKREYITSFSAVGRKTAFIRGANGGIDWNTIGLTHQELSYIESRKMSQEEIFGVYHIPMGIIRENVTEASAKVAVNVYKEGCLWPRLTRVAQKMTKDLAPFWGTNLIVEPDEIRDIAPDPTQISAAARYLTDNEARAKWYNLGALPGGDVLPSARAVARTQVASNPQQSPTAASSDSRTNNQSNANTPAKALRDDGGGVLLLPSDSRTNTHNVIGQKFSMPPAHPHCDCTVSVEWDYHTDGHIAGVKMFWRGNGTSCDICAARIGKEIKDVAPLEYRQQMVGELSQMERWALRRVGKLTGKSFDLATMPLNVAESILSHLTDTAGEADIKALFAALRDGLL